MRNFRYIIDGLLIFAAICFQTGFGDELERDSLSTMDSANPIVTGVKVRIKEVQGVEPGLKEMAEG